MQTTRNSTKNAMGNSQNNISDADTGTLCVIQNVLEKKDFSERTVRAFVSDMQCFARWYARKNREPLNPRRITERDVSDFKREAQASGLSVATVNRRLVHLRLFCEQVVRLKWLASNPAKEVKLLPTQPLAPKSLSPQELRKFLKEVELRGDLRDRLIVELMAGAGLRASEVVALRRSDIVLSEKKGHATVRASKGGKTRIVPLNQQVRIMARKHMEKLADEYLFVGQRGPLRTCGITCLIRKYAELSRVEAHPHTFRHTFATNYLRNNPGDIVGLSQLLGHGNINTTAIYTQNRLEDLQERVERVEW